MIVLASAHSLLGIRIGLAVFCLAVIAVTFESIRKTSLKERYALLWIVPCFLLLVLTAFPRVLDWMKNVFGMTYASSMACVIFFSLVCAVFFLSCAISKAERNISRLAQKCASLEARLAELEKRSGK